MERLWYCSILAKKWLLELRSWAPFWITVHNETTNGMYVENVAKYSKRTSGNLEELTVALWRVAVAVLIIFCKEICALLYILSWCSCCIHLLSIFLRSIDFRNLGSLKPWRVAWGLYRSRRSIITDSHHGTRMMPVKDKTEGCMGPCVAAELISLVVVWKSRGERHNDTDRCAFLRKWDYSNGTAMAPLMSLPTWSYPCPMSCPGKAYRTARLLVVHPSFPIATVCTYPYQWKGGDSLFVRSATLSDQTTIL